MEFKNEGDFKNSGFGYSNSGYKYRKWQDSVTKLKTECDSDLVKIKDIVERLDSELFALCNITTDIGSLGRKYAMNSSKDNKRSKKQKAEIEKVLNVKK
jgi:hypothetical protein